jgi:hypothetical protein
MTNFRRDARPVFPVLCLAIALTACGGPSQDTNRSAPTAAPSEETFRDFGDYEIHFNALRTDQLTPDVARAYGIQRSANRVLLNVTMLQEAGAGAPRRPVAGEVSVDAYNLNGQLKNLELRQVTEGEAIYYIGEVTISGTEILVFDIRARPQGAPSTYEMKFKREFYAD